MLLKKGKYNSVLVAYQLKEHFFHVLKSICYSTVKRYRYIWLKLWLIKLWLYSQWKNKSNIIRQWCNLHLSKKNILYLIQYDISKNIGISNIRSIAMNKYMKPINAGEKERYLDTSYDTMCIQNILVLSFETLKVVLWNWHYPIFYSYMMLYFRQNIASLRWIK